MSSNVNESITNYQVLTGNTVAVTRRSALIGITWDDDSNIHHAPNPQTATFPDILNNAALPNDWLQRHLTQLVIDASRIIAGVETDN